MLKHNEVNLLTVYGLRELQHCPKHFTTVDFSLQVPAKAISDWVWTNLSGRFWFGDWYYKDAGGNVQMEKRIAFEIAGEASMFALILDQINTPVFDF
jgi:hypothetical protein